jgi:eukaryotic-like serine/threonine-protein kinase
MTPPRDPESAEPTLLPGSPSAAPSAAPGDTPAHPSPHDETLEPPPVAGLTPEPHSLNGSVTEADITLAPMPSTNGAAGAEVTRVPAPLRGVAEKTVGPNKTIANSLSAGPELSSTPGLPVASPAATGTMVGRFALKGLHAKGGLGEVFTARDTELNRDVAVKRIQSRYADDPSSRRRFLSEAEITARLDHPGVVPVFGLVTDGLGRPCYAMRFIRGETLKDEIDRYHQGSGVGSQGSEKTEKSGSASNDPGTAAARIGEGAGQPRTVMFRQLLQRFIAVCQAIGYAHTRKVIHRDIKPANVMVGAFGETLVVDWGLAKALDDGPDTEQVMKAIAEGGYRHDPDATEMPSHMTLAGTAVGTPAYMAPEQASGRLELVGTGADVYSLGATLYVILTGKSAFSGNTADTLEKVRRGDFPRPHSLNPDTPAPLEAICLKAMALRPEDRYSTTLELAADIERWRSDEPVSCYRDPILARLARWARRHPARVAAAVSLLVAGVVAAVAIVWAVTEERNKTAAERDRATLAEKATREERDTVTLQKAEIVKQKDAIEDARKVAQERYELSVQAFNTLVTDIQKLLASRTGTQEFRAKLLKKAQDGLNALLKGAGAERIGADRTLVAAHIQMGNVYHILGNTLEARKQYDDAVKMAEDVLNQRKDSWEAKRDLGNALLSQSEIRLHLGDTAGARTSCERACGFLRDVLKENPGDPEAVANVAAAEDQLADILMERGETEAATEQSEAALKARRALANAHPDDPEAQRQLADSLEQSAQILLHAGRTTEALTVAADCLRVRIKVHEMMQDQPDVRRELAAAHTGLGEIHIDRGDFAAAHTDYESALKILQPLIKDDPRNAPARSAEANANSRLAFIEVRLGNLEEALKFATTGKELGEKLDRADPDSTRTSRDLAQSYEQFGEVLLARGKPDKALEAFVKSEELLAPLEKADRDSARAKSEHARALERVGEGRLANANAADAVSALTDSVGLREKVMGLDKGSARAKRELATSLGWLAQAQRADGNCGTASDTIARAVTLLREVVNKDDKLTPARRELAAATGQWGEVLHELGKSTTALITESQSLEQFRALSEADKNNAQAKADTAAAWERLAALYADLGQTVPAGAAASNAVTLRTELAKQAGETKAAKRELAEAKIRVGETYTALRQYALARKEFKEARGLVAPDPVDPAMTAAALLAEKKVALIAAVETIEKDPILGPSKVPAELRVDALRTTMEAYLKAGEPVTAASLADRLAEHDELPAREYYAAARALARCAATKNTNITASAIDSFKNQAVAALGKAIAVGFRNAEALRGSEWNVCRDLPAFQKLLKELETAKQK